MLTHAESGVAAGGLRWCDLAIWQVTTTWAAATPAPAAAVCLDVIGSHAAWRAEQWWQRLPVLASVDRSSLVVAPPGWATLADACPAVEGPVGRVAAVVRVLLPRLAADLEHWAGRASPLGDGPLLRTIGQARADVAADWARASAVLAGLLVSGAAADEAAAAVSWLDGASVTVRPAGDEAGEAPQ